MTELADIKTVAYRIGTGIEQVVDTVPWRRRVGGRMGAEIRFRPGTYSDDTQLRLATSRAIRGDGEFDVSAFAKIELVAWLAYALGAGRGSKAAAAGLMRADAKWTQNIYSAKDVHYVNVGGNGAAMRIQPHVWSARNLGDLDLILRDVVRNAVCTHGHMRGIFGAALHAALLAYTIDQQRAPGPSDLVTAIDQLSVTLPAIVMQDEELANLWLPAWESAQGSSFTVETSRVADECREAAGVVHSLTGNPRDLYIESLTKLGGFDPGSRGSGTLSAIFASYLTHLYQDDPAAGIRLAANALGSDTDTIATMAGAQLGALVKQPPPSGVQDMKLILAEAERLWNISAGRVASSFRYPDLLAWSSPKANLDLVGDIDGQPVLAGIGTLRPVTDAVRSNGRPASSFQWMSLPFDQHVLVRFREPRPSLKAGQVPSDSAWPSSQGPTPSLDGDLLVLQEGESDKEFGQQALAFGGQYPSYRRAYSERMLVRRRTDEVRAPSRRPAQQKEATEQALARVVASNFDHATIGEVLIGQLYGGEYDVERAAALAGLIAREWRKRHNR